MLILAVITIRLVNTSLDSDRLKAGSRELQSYLAGARDRAIYAGQPRGVRFIPDANDPYSVHSFVYIGAPTNFSDGQTMGATPGSTGIGPSLATIQTLYSLANRGVLLAGAQLLLSTTGSTSQNGSYYSIAPFVPALPADPPMWQPGIPYSLGSTIQPATTNGHTYVCTTGGTSGTTEPAWPPAQAAQITDGTNPGAVVWTEFSWVLTKNYVGTVPVQASYSLQVAPSQLPSEQPRTLPQNIVIDLRTSVLPAGWTFPPTPSSTYDVLFSPAGTVIGPVAASGRVHFVLSDVAVTAGETLINSLATPTYSRLQLNAPWLPSTQFAVGNVVVPTPLSSIAYRCTVPGTSAAAPPAQFITPTPNQTFTDNGVTWQSFVKKADLIVSLATATGRVTVHPVDMSTPLTVSSAFGNVTGYDSFRLAEIGEVTQ
jgi:hypothetical protein